MSRPVDGGPDLPSAATSPTIDTAGDRISFLASGAIDSPATSTFEVYVRDRRDQTTTPVSRADGAGGALGDADAVASSIAGSGDCVAFAGRFTNLGDGFGSADFDSVHLRTLRNTCPGADMTGSTGTGSTGSGTTTTSTPPPVRSALTLTPSRFFVRGRRAGTTIRYTLSRGARVTLRFDRLIGGHRNGRRCLTKGRGKRCTIVAHTGALTVTGRAGRNRVRFNGKLRGRALRAGRYRLTATHRQEADRGLRHSS